MRFSPRAVGIVNAISLLECGGCVGALGADGNHCNPGVVPRRLRIMRRPSIAALFESLPGHLDADAAENLTAVFQFDLSGSNGGCYHLTVTGGVCTVGTGAHATPDVTFSMSGDDCLGVLTGRLDGAAVFMSGRLRVEGDLGLALQLPALFPSVRKLESSLD